MKGDVCKICGFISIDGQAPEHCPVCGAPKTSFETKEDAIKESKDEVNLSEKHTPVITIVKKCDIIGASECTNVAAKVGSVTHPMLAEHLITNIDFYLDKQFIARVHLTVDKLNPAVTLHLKVASGKLTVIERCNKHGAWIGETEL